MENTFVPKEAMDILKKEYGFILSDKAIFLSYPDNSNEIVLPVKDDKNTIFLFRQYFEYAPFYEKFYEGDLQLCGYDKKNQKIVPDDNRFYTPINDEFSGKYWRDIPDAKRAVIMLSDAVSKAGNINMRDMNTKIPDTVCLLDSAEKIDTLHSVILDLVEERKKPANLSPDNKDGNSVLTVKR